jgi:ribose/xylose/arabinose/galactoside ABC-type transport system permease subunit
MSVTQQEHRIEMGGLGTAIVRERRPFRLPRMQELGLVIVILIIGAVLTMIAAPVRGENGFLRPGNLIPSVFTTMSWMAVMAIGVSIVVISGGIDISVGSVMGLAALAAAAALQHLPEDASPWRALPVGIGVPLAVGAMCGLINGAIVVGLRMHPFIVTLGTMSIFRGIALVSVHEGSLPFGDKVLPRAFTDHFIAYTTTFTRASGRQEFFQPVPMIVMIVVMLLGWLYLHWMVWGRETYAVGGNEEAARYSGIQVGWTKLRTYFICGLCAGIAGMISCGFYKSAATNTGLGYELMVVAAAVVGGASLSGGRGTALGAVLGTLVIQLIDNAISLPLKIGSKIIQVDKQYTMIIVGVAIIFAVAVDRFSEYLQARRLARLGRAMR